MERNHIRSAVGAAREAGAGKNVMLIGADVARQCIQSGLVDEIRMFLARVLLGDGVRFFNWPGAREAVRLEPSDVWRRGQLANVGVKFLE
jgi:dihydrofolate reductase